MLTVDLSRLPADVRAKVDEIVRQDWDLRVVKAIEEQKRAAAHFHSNPRRAREGLGPQTMAIHPTLYQMWSAARGPETWNDPDWVEYFRKHSPECGVPEHTGRIQVSVPGLAGAPTRFKKTYG